MLLLGYYARWASMRKLLFQFLDAEVQNSDGPSPQKQILSLGAGFDTTYFQLVVSRSLISVPPHLI